MKKVILSLIALCISFAIFAQKGDIKVTQSVCKNDSILLPKEKTGGTWLSNDPSVAIAKSVTTDNTFTWWVLGINPGQAKISHIVNNIAVDSVTVTVNALPQDIIGVKKICLLDSSQLGNAAPGGTWSSSSLGYAIVDPQKGLAKGLNPGTSVITYTLPTGCKTTTIVTVDGAPAVNPILGPRSVCVYDSITLNDTGGNMAGTWSSSNTAIGSIDPKGIVKGLAAGTIQITYTLSTGCKAVATVTVNPMPAKITGKFGIYAGMNTKYTDSPTGGTWSSSKSEIVMIDPSTGSATGSATGTSSITYTLSGCPSPPVTVTVNAPAGTIAGNTSSIAISSTLQLSDAVTGGTWASGNPTVAALASTTTNPVTVTGVRAGTATITYTAPPASSVGYATATVTVNAAPPPPDLSPASILQHAQAIVDSDKAESISIGHIFLTDTVPNIFDGVYKQYRHDSEKYHNWHRRFIIKFIKHKKRFTMPENINITRDNFDTEAHKLRMVTNVDTIEKVELNINNGYINYARVTVRYGSKKTLLENNSMYFSIPYTKDNKKSSVLCDTKGDKCLILNDVISYESNMDTKNYTPNDDTFTLIPVSKPSAALSRNIDLNSNIDFRLYTDLLGVLNKQSNGLVQADATTTIFLNYITTTVFKTDGLVLFNFIQPSFSYSKFATQSNALNIADSTQPLFLTDSQRVALYQMSYLQLGAKLSIAKFMFGSNFIELNGGINYNFSNIQLGADAANLKAYNTWSLYPEVAAELLNTDNFGLDLYLKFLWQNTVSTNLLVYGYEDFYFIPEIAMYYYPGDSKSNKVFLKLKLTEQESSSTRLDQNILDYKRGFFSLQFGYSAKLKF